MELGSAVAVGSVRVRGQLGKREDWLLEDSKVIDRHPSWDTSYIAHAAFGSGRKLR